MSTGKTLRKKQILILCSFDYGDVATMNMKQALILIILEMISEASPLPGYNSLPLKLGRYYLLSRI